ncbi:MAG: TatD family hydrolase [Bacteroidales bacterium]|jgi:TatD DNase family protein|nr:TatD family hydrolase [Bacteroidales bacterium]
MIFADSHTHFYFEDYKPDLQASFDRAIGAGVQYMVIPNVDSSTIAEVSRICDTFPKNCFPAIGLHPTDVKEDYKTELETMLNAADARRYYAIGETGLDLYHDKTFLAEQIEAFDAQIQLAKAKNLPLIIHSRDAFEETMKILKRHKDQSLRGVFHCFTGSVEQAKRIVDLGFYLGIGGVVTFKNSKLWQVVEAIGLEHILLETDAPFIAPHPHRGTRNEPSYIPIIAQRIAEIKNIPIETVSEKTTEQTLKLFGI